MPEARQYAVFGPLLSGAQSRAFLGCEVVEGVPRRDRPVVVVWLPDDVTSDPKAVARLQRETAFVTQLRHPNIIRVHGLECFDEGWARIVDFADAEPLAKVLARAREEFRPIDPRIAARIIVDICQGVHHAHEEGQSRYAGRPIVHGGVRPDTILITFKGETMVTGYGASVLAPTQHGTPAADKFVYFAPEQIIGGKATASPASDVYAIGAVLYELVAGHAPYAGASDVERAVLTGDPPLLEATGLAGRLGNIAATAMAKRGADRFDTVDIMREAIEKALVDDGVEMPPHEDVATLVGGLIPPSAPERKSRRELLDSADDPDTVTVLSRPDEAPEGVDADLFEASRPGPVTGGLREPLPREEVTVVEDPAAVASRLAPSPVPVGMDEDEPTQAQAAPTGDLEVDPDPSAPLDPAAFSAPAALPAFPGGEAQGWDTQVTESPDALPSPAVVSKGVREAIDAAADLDAPGAPDRAPTDTHVAADPAELVAPTVQTPSAAPTPADPHAPAAPADATPTSSPVVPAAQAPHAANPGASQAPNLGASRAPNPDASQAPNLGASQAPNPGASQAPNPGASQAPTPGASQAPNLGASQAPNLGASQPPTPGAAQAPTPSAPHASTLGAAQTPSPGAPQAPNPGGPAPSSNPAQAPSPLAAAAPTTQPPGGHPQAPAPSSAPGVPVAPQVVPPQWAGPGSAPGVAPQWAQPGTPANAQPTATGAPPWGQPGSAPGVAPQWGQPGTHPGQPGAPQWGQPGTHPGQAGAHPGQAGTHPGQAGTHPGQAGTHPGQAGTYPGQPGAPQWGQPGTHPGQPGTPQWGQPGSAPGAQAPHEVPPVYPSQTPQHMIATADVPRPAQGPPQPGVPGSFVGRSANGSASLPRPAPAATPKAPIRDDSSITNFSKREGDGSRSLLFIIVAVAAAILVFIFAFPKEPPKGLDEAPERHKLPKELVRAAIENAGKEGAAPDPEDDEPADPETPAMAETDPEKVDENGEPVEAPPKLRTGTLTLESEPRVYVFVDTHSLGRTPLTTQLPTGRHKLRFTDKRTGINVYRRYRIRAGGEHKDRITFGTSSLVVNAPDGATIMLNGKKVGTAPMDALEIYEGSYLLRVRHDSASWSERFDAPPGRKIEYNVRLSN
ncbi:MAG: protein kinase [Deltaproteobacteria bacterium]